MRQMTLQQELNHWWIATRFRYLARAIKNTQESSRKPRITVLEVGAGTLQNLVYVRKTTTLSEKVHSYVGMERYVDPTYLCKLKNSFSPHDRVVKGLEELDVHAPFDLVVAMDVLEHIENDSAALQNWSQYLTVGGSMLVTVPAFPRLWSYHDTLLGHYRRYSKSHFASVVAQDGQLRITSLAYAFSYVFPFVFILRKLKHRGAWKPKRTDLSPTNPFLNWLLKGLGIIESSFVGNPYFGTSLVGFINKHG